MAFSFELGLVISSELYGAISAGPEQSFAFQTAAWFLSTLLLWKMKW